MRKKKNKDGFALSPICIVVEQVKTEDRQFCRQISDSLAIRKLVRGFTLVELMVAFAIIVIVFAAVVPQFRAIRNSWASAEAKATIIQNGRVLEEHIIRNLSKAKRITAVSSSSITFRDNNDVNQCYMLSDENVVFGAIGSEEPLAGPVSSFQISCYSIDPCVALTTDCNIIRLVKIDTDFTNTQGSNKTFTASAYLQTNANVGGNWCAYNDCVYDAGLVGYGTDPLGNSVHYGDPNRITVYGIGTISGDHQTPPGVGYSASSGLLKDYATGASTGVTATLTQSGGVVWQPMDGNVAGSNWAGGYDTAVCTDAYNTFHGIVDMTGTIYYGSAGWYVDVNFTGLDPSKTYTFATSASRAKDRTDGANGYSDRWSIYTISGVDAATNASTPGTTEPNGTPYVVKFNTGNNHFEGYVARWTGIRPGTDGSFKVRAEAAPDANAGYKAYAFDVFELQSAETIAQIAYPISYLGFSEAKAASDTNSLTISTPGSSGAVAILGSWLTGLSHPNEPGNNRALIFIAHEESTSGSPTLTSVTYGGQAMTKVIERSAVLSGYGNYVAAFILNESGVAAATSGTFVPTWSATTSSVSYASVFLSNVDQTTSIGASASNSTTTSTNPITTSALSTNNGDMVIDAATDGNNGSYTLGGGFTEGTDQSVGANGHTGVTGYKSATGANETPSATHSNTAVRQVIIGFVVKTSAEITDIAGDLLIAAVATDGSTSLTTPADWTLINRGSNGTAVTLGAWWKIAVASESSPTFTWTGGNEQAYGWMMRFTGANPITGTPATADSTSANPTSPAVTTAAGCSLILRLGAFDDDDITVDAPGLSGHAAITMDESAASSAAVPVAILGSWAKNLTHAKEAGTNRALIFIAHAEDNDDPSIVLSSVSYGTRAMTKVIERAAGGANPSSRTYVAVFQLDEVGVAAASTTTFSVTWNQTPDDANYESVFLQNVNQTTPIGATDSNGTTTGYTVVTGALATSSGDMVFDAATDSNIGSYTTNNGFTEAFEVAFPLNSTDGVVGYKSATGANETPSVTHSTGNGRQSLIGFVVKGVPGGTVSGGAGYIRQLTTGPSSGTPTFSLTASNEARAITIAITPADANSNNCCGDVRP
jgi:type II secretory pathway pseudopilin PulG